MRKAHILTCLILSGCSAAGGPYPSLQPRAAEAIDPRVPVVKPMNDRPASMTLTSALAELVSQAKNGDTAFQQPMSAAEQLAGRAGAPQSESWIAAQEALTAAIAARRPTATALGDIDELGARALQRQGGLAPNDLLAIRRAAATVSAIDDAQARRVEATQRRLGL